MEVETVNNLEQDILRLRLDAKTEADNLTSILKKKDEAQLDYEKSLKDISEEKKRFDEYLKDNLERIENEKNLLIKLVEESNVKFSLINKEVKDRTNELKRLNLWIIDAIDDQNRKQEKNIFLDSEIKRKEKLIENILSLENENSELEEKRDDLKIEVKLSQDDYTKQIDELEIKVKKLIEIANDSRRLASDAEYRKKKFDDEYDVKVKDLNIYYKRIVRFYKEAFPDKPIPILK